MPATTWVITAVVFQFTEWIIQQDCTGWISQSDQSVLLGFTVAQLGSGWSSQLQNICLNHYTVKSQFTLASHPDWTKRVRFRLSPSYSPTLNQFSKYSNNITEQNDCNSSGSSWGGAKQFELKGKFPLSIIMFGKKSKIKEPFQEQSARFHLTTWR